jgi:photosystem II stability/assembly factor-like uncharacterized protein
MVNIVDKFVKLNIRKNFLMDKDGKSKLFEIFTTLLFYTSLLLFFVAFNFRDNPGGWQLQNITNFKGQSISDVIFLDSLTGIFVTNDNIAYDTSYIFKTTNGGNNWMIKFVHPGGFNRISFIDSLVGYACGGTNTGTPQLYKTTNRGENWSLTNSPSTNFWNDMYILNKDTMWLVDRDGLLGGIFRTTDGGVSWILQNSLKPDKIYMVNKNLGFIRRGDAPFGSYIGRTTNGGFNWTLNTNVDTTFSDMYFLDSLTGYKCDLNIQKTTDGGLTWTWQVLPHLNYANIMSRFSFINKDTIFGVGGIYSFPSTDRGLVYKTTNGGINWGYQIPDTSFGIYSLWYVDFVDKLNGWAFRPNSKNIHTTTGGGDTTFYTNINSISNGIVKNFELKQNYPNPYNNSTLIEYFINESGWVKLKIFDIAGREIATLVNEVQSTGGYGMPVSVQLSSGVYFYKLVYTNKKGEMQMDVKKMVLLK